MKRRRHGWGLGIACLLGAAWSQAGCTSETEVPPQGSGGGGTANVGGGVGSGGDDTSGVGGQAAGGGGGEAGAPPAPVAAIDGNYHFDKGVDAVAVAAATGLLANDTGQAPLAVSSFDATTAWGAAVAVSDDGSFEVTPGPAFFGADIFGYQVGDATSQTDGDYAKLVGVPITGALSAIASGEATGFAAIGEAEGDAAGAVAASAGDVDGDGLDDMIVGASNAGGDSGNFRAYVVFGKPDGASVDLSDVAGGTGGFAIDGPTNGERLHGVAAAGDVNGDGLGDVLVAAYDDDGYGGGLLFVVFGHDGGATVALDDVRDGEGGFVVRGEESGPFSVSGAGDVNGDGLDDIVLGAFGDDGKYDLDGAAYVVHGKADGAQVELADVREGDGGFVVQAGDTGKYGVMGMSVDGAGDMNGDGFADIVVGAALSPGDGKYDAAYVVFGKADTDPVLVEDVAYDGAGFAVIGEGSSGPFGFHVGGGGDFNGDGVNDIVLGKYGSELHVVFGKSDGEPVLITGPLEAPEGLSILSQDTGTDSKYSAAINGDVNGDGLADLVVPREGSEGTGAGVFVIWGRQGDTELIDLADVAEGNGGFFLEHEEQYAEMGRTVDLESDLNGDGISDIVLSAPSAADAGTTYVVFGADYSRTTTGIGGPERDVVVAGLGSEVADVLVSEQGDDLLISDGGPDVLLAGRGDDEIVLVDTAFLRIHGGGGFDTVTFGADDMALDLLGVGVDNLRSIEQFDMTGHGNNTLTIDRRLLGTLSPSHQAIVVLGEAGDVVVIDVDDADVSNTAGFDIYDFGTVRLEISAAVSVTAPEPPPPP